MNAAQSISFPERVLAGQIPANNSTPQMALENLSFPSPTFHHLESLP